MFFKVGIIGAGSYGTALAQCFSNRANEIILISNVEEIASDINNFHVNRKFFDNISLSHNISCTTNFQEIKTCDIIFVVVPMKNIISIFEQIRENQIQVPVILCSKGLNIKDGSLQSDLLEKIIDNEYAIFSGPSFAHEIICGLPASVNIASKGRELSEKISRSLSNKTLNIKVIDDYIGLQITGAMKNVLAVGCGILSGMKLGSGAIARFITMGLHEISALIVEYGGKKETIWELGGLGDIILTCSTKQSRNILFGEYLASGGNINEWSGSLSEGAFTAKVVPFFKTKLKILSAIYNATYENKLNEIVECIDD